MDPEELRALFAKARNARSEGRDLDAINRRIGVLTGGQATDIETLATLVGRTSERVTTEETPSAIPRSLRVPAAVVQQFGEGATFGGLGELSGAIDALFAKGDQGEAFRSGRAAQEDALSQFQEERPGLSTAAQLTGGLASGILAPAQAGLLKSGSAAGAVGKGALIGAGEGALQGALSGEGAGGRVGGGLVGGGLGALLGGATGGLAAGATGLARRFMNQFIRSPQTPRGSVAKRGLQFMRDFFEDADFKPQGLADDVESVRRARPRATRDDFKLSDHAAFTELSESADDLLSKPLTLQVDDAVKEANRLRGIVDAPIGVEGLAPAAAVATFSPGLAAAKTAASLSGRPLARRALKKKRAALRWLRDQLQTTDVTAQQDFLRSLSPTTSINPLVGATPAAVEQLLGPTPNSLQTLLTTPSQ